VNKSAVLMIIRVSASAWGVSIHSLVYGDRVTLDSERDWTLQSCTTCLTHARAWILRPVCIHCNIMSYNWLPEPDNSVLSSDSYRQPGMKRPGHGVDHSPPSCVEVENEWSYTSAAAKCLHDVDRDNCTFLTASRKALTEMGTPPKVAQYTSSGCLF
jgi:hypothetical protein